MINTDTSQWTQALAKAPVETAQAVGQTKPALPAAIGEKIDAALEQLKTELAAFEKAPTPEGAKALRENGSKVMAALASLTQQYDIPADTLGRVTQLMTRVGDATEPYVNGSAKAPPTQTTPVNPAAPPSPAAANAKAEEATLNVSKAFRAFDESPTKETAAALTSRVAELKQVLADAKVILPSSTVERAEALISTAEFMLQEKGFGKAGASTPTPTPTPTPPVATPPTQAPASTPSPGGIKLDVSDAYKPLFDQGKDLQKVMIGGQAFFRRDSGDMAYVKAPDGSVMRFDKKGLPNDTMNAVIRQSVAPDSDGARLTFTLNGKSVPVQIANTKDGLVVFKAGTNDVLYAGKSLDVPRDQLGKAVAELLQKQEPFMGYFKQNAQAAPAGDQPNVQQPTTQPTVKTESTTAPQSVLQQAADLAGNLENKLETFQGSKTPENRAAVAEAGQQLIAFAQANAAALPPEAQSAILTLLKKAQAAVDSPN